MLRRAASGHIEAMQLSKFVAASRIALAVMSGCPEAPSSPLQGCGPALEGVDGIAVPDGVWVAFDDEPPKRLPRKSRGLLPLADCACAEPHPNSTAASSTVPIRPADLVVHHAMPARYPCRKILSVQEVLPGFPIA